MGFARAGGLTLVIALCACAHAPQRASPPAADGVFHHVKAGETLYRIARTYGVPMDALLRENLIDNAAGLREGQTLFIPGAAREVEVPPAAGQVQARLEPRAPRKTAPTLLPRAGTALDPAAGGTPLAWPTPGVLVSPFGTRDHAPHDGIDLAAPEGTDVRAAADGLVLFAGEQRGYGKLILVAHEGDLVTVYAHNSENLVEKGERVHRGDRIARVGHTGNATGPHLHFEVRVAARPHDPLGFLR